MPAPLLPYRFVRKSPEQMEARANALLMKMEGRRSCRHFSPEPVPGELIERVLAIAHTAPSGANRKPWRFAAIDDPKLKQEIRLAAEAEERENYGRRMPPEWLEALEPLGTDASKPFLEIAPWLIVMLRIDWEVIGASGPAGSGRPEAGGSGPPGGTSGAPGGGRPDSRSEAAPGHRRSRFDPGAGRRVPNYYPHESAGIAAGFFLMACHQVGLATLTHTPSPMGFLREILGRPANEKPYLLIPVGYPAPDCTVPDIPKKPLSEALQWNTGAAGSRLPAADGG